MPHVYFIKPVEMDGPIKIGCSMYPETRLRSLMSWSPVDLEIVAQVDGDFDLERRLHAMFAAHYRRQEWFNPAPELLALIDDINAGKPINDLVDHSIDPRDMRPGYRRSEEHRRYMGYRTKISFAMRRIRDGKYWYSEPDDVADIMDRWGQFGFSTGRAVPPTEQEIARLNAFLADPKSQVVRGSW